MKCDKAFELLSASHEGDLGEALRVAFEAHLAACPDCRVAAAQIGALHASLSAMPIVSAPDGLRPEIWRRIEALEPPQKARALSVPWFTWRRLALAGGLAALGVGLFTRVSIPGVFRPAGWLSGKPGLERTSSASQPFSTGAVAYRTQGHLATLSLPVSNRSGAPLELSAFVGDEPNAAAPWVTVAPGLSAVLSAAAPDHTQATGLTVRWRQGKASGQATFEVGRRG